MEVGYALPRIAPETVDSYAFTNRALLRDVPRAFVVVFHGLGGGLSIRTEYNDFELRCAAENVLTSVGASQIISNVPAAVLLSGFTDQWRELLAGVNIGGLGTPIASLASLITLKLYMRWPGAKVGAFIGVFLAANVIGLVILLGFAGLIM